MATTAPQPWTFACDACAGKSVVLPQYAACVAGNARTFTDPRNYESLKHNLLDALGANTTVFLYLKLKDDLKPKEFVGYTPSHAGTDNHTVHSRLRDAIHALKQSYKVVVKLEHATVPVRLNGACNWMRGNPTALANVGQLQTNEMCYSMITEYEEKHQVAFTHVLKTRPDLAWPTAAHPWCMLVQEAAYASSPMPADWFLLVPRAVATSMLKLHSRYQACGGATQLPNFPCCGDGITALLMGALRSANVPVIGPRLPGAPNARGVINHHFPGVDFLFYPMLYRAGSGNRWCSGGHGFDVESLIPDAEMCERVMEYRGLAVTA